MINENRYRGYNRPRPDPKEMRSSAMSVILVGAIFLLIGVGHRLHSAWIRNKCTAHEAGVVSDVKESRHNIRVTVTLREGNSFGKTEVSSEWTRRTLRMKLNHTLDEGRSAEVYFDPDDPSLYYIKDAGPDDGVRYLLGGGAFLAVGAVMYIRSRQGS